MVYGSGEGDAMQTVLYVYESQNNNGWKWCAVQTDERIGEVQRLDYRKESLRINSKPAAVSIGVSTTSRLGIDIDRVEFRRPQESKPAASYPAELAAMKARAETAEAKVQELESSIKLLKGRVAEWTVWADSHLGSQSKLALSGRDRRERLSWILEHETGPEVQPIAWGAPAVGTTKVVAMSRTVYEAKLQELAETKTELAAARGKVQELSRLPDQIEQVTRWHDWADATLGLISGRAISATEKQNAITLKIQWLKDRTRGPSILEQLILTWGDAPVGSGEYVRLPRLMYQAKVQELAATKTELAAARGLVMGLENNRSDLLGQLAVVAEELDGVSRKAARLSEELVISTGWVP